MSSKQNNCLNANALAEHLPDLIANLPESERELVLLRYHAGKKAREIAELLSISNPAVRKRLERIRLKLGEALLASLKRDTAEEKRRDRKAARIASAVLVVPPPWKKTATGVAGAGTFGVATFFKTVALTILVVTGGVATYLNVHTQAPDSNTVQSSSTAPVQIVERIAEVVPPEDMEDATKPTQEESSPPIRVAEGASITGRLYEEDTGDGVAAGVIRFYSPTNEEGAETETDENGNYLFEGLPPGEYIVRLKWDNEDQLLWRYPRSRYKRQEQSIQLEDNVFVTGVDFVVTGGLPVRGRVIGPDGEVLAGAIVDGWSQPNAIEAETKTDTEGRFEFHGFGTDLPAFFWPRYPGLAMPPRGPITIPTEGVEDLVLTMHAESVIAGRLVDQYANPLPDVRLTPWPRNMSTLPNEFVTVTDDAGNFEMQGLHASSYHFTISFGDEINSRRLTNMGEIELAEGEQLRNIELVYEFPGDLTISGRVTDDTGEPSNRITVHAIRGNIRRHAKTDAEGLYELGELGPGIYNVMVQNASMIGLPEASSEAESGSRKVDFVIPRKAAASGTVIDAETEEPIPSFEVMYPNNSRQWTRFNNPEGHFELRSIDSTTQRSIVARAEGYTLGFSKQLIFSPGEERTNIVIHLEMAGVVSGQVFDPDGKPIRDTNVGLDTGISGGGSRTGADGKFVISDARPGTWPLITTHPSYAPGEVQITVRPGEATNADIQLLHGAQMRGAVHQHGEPLNDVRIELYQQIDEFTVGYSKQVKTDQDGNYTFVGIPTGDLTLHLNPMLGNQGRVIQVPVHINGSEEQAFDVEVYSGEASAIFDIEMSDELIEQDGTIQVEITYLFETGESERYYTFGTYGDEIRLEGVRPGVATLSAKYYVSTFRQLHATTASREIILEQDIENKVNITLSEPSPE